MAKSRKKKNAQKDFQKVKFKVGKKLKKADNVTNASFQTRTIQVTQKIKTATTSEPSSRRKLNVNELLNQFQHYSTSTRHDAVMGLRELFSSHTEIIVPNLATVIERSTHLFVDKDPVVRQSVIKLLKVVFTAVSEKHVSPFLHMISAHLCCAMTHIYEDIQADSLQILDLLLNHFPGLVVSNSNQILPNFIEQISRSKLDTKRGSSALAINPNLKMASHKWRAKVLTRLHKLLSAILGNADKTDKVSQDSQSGVQLLTWKKSEISYVQPKPEHFTSKYRQPGFMLRSKMDNITKKGVTLSDEAGLRKFVQLMIPLLIECWIESNTVSTYSNKGSDNMITADSLPLRSSVVSVIQLLCQYVIQTYPLEKKWLQKMYLTDFKSHLLKCFPYYVHIPVKKKDKGDNMTMQDSVCSLNIAICDIMTNFLSAPSSEREDNAWEITMIQYLEDIISHGCHDKQQMRIVIEILNRLIKQEDNLSLDSICDVMIRKYKDSHPLSTDKKLFFYFFSDIILDRKERSKLGADIIDIFITSLPDLFITVANSNEQMAAQVLNVMKTSACQNCWVLLQQLNKFICKTIENDDILINLHLQTQKSLLELVYYVPQLQESSLKIYLKLLRNSKFPRQSCLYLLQIMHHRYASLEKTPLRTADYVSFMLSVLLGDTKEETGEQHSYEVIGEADDNFLTGSMKWERTLDITEVVCLHLTQFGDTDQVVQIVSTFLNQLQSKDTHLTECQFISLMILSNKMEFYKYPITDSFTASLVPHFWMFCCKVTVTHCLLSDTVVQLFRSVYSVVLDRLVDSLCHMKNGLQLLISVLKKNLHGRKNKMTELREVCQAGSLWLRHYDNWIQMPNDPVELVPEIAHSVSIIQESCSELREQQWWSDFSFLVSRIKL